MWAVMVVLSVQVGAGLAYAQATSPSVAPPPQVQELLKILDDPATRVWIDQQRRAATGASVAAPQAEAMNSEMLAGGNGTNRARLAALTAAVPGFSWGLKRAGGFLSQEIHSRALF